MQTVQIYKINVVMTKIKHFEGTDLRQVAFPLLLQLLLLLPSPAAPTDIRGGRR